VLHRGPLSADQPRPFTRAFSIATRGRAQRLRTIRVSRPWWGVVAVEHSTDEEASMGEQHTCE
jgi:hypothetical protein